MSIATFETTKRSVSKRQRERTCLEERAEVVEVHALVGEKEELRQRELPLAEDPERGRDRLRP